MRTSPVGVRGSDLESSLTPRNDAAEPGPFTRISRPLLRAAAERVAANWKDESGESLNAERCAPC